MTKRSKVKEIILFDENLKLVRWVNDNCPPIDLNSQPIEVVRLVNELHRMNALLKVAFEAGENRGRFVMKEGDSTYFHSDYPDFETWKQINKIITKK